MTSAASKTSDRTSSALCSRVQRDGRELSDVGRTIELPEVIDPTMLVEFMVRKDAIAGDVRDEDEVHMKPLGARHVLLIPDEPGRGALHAELDVEAAFEPRLLEELAAGGLERGLAGLVLAADG